ncbi:protocatechuate 3,4-dioxygenase beta subunit [Roseovarius azorensis]|uniref:Protocatechuate 3,4-dioxygenase beta subunit n=1 Tax=Roseovarius azorensis TaxID=1287727 RepID=A0A1H7IXG9_9RHOB|nr:protocatechuate 3,4-dioxygenase [Roseovarius azorensis]SEK65505.1 protocatechuate 3,4-dioxygenase beta subunit [Roseovarius azorensis]
MANDPQQTPRRRFLGYLSGLVGIGLMARPAHAVTPTPPQTEGPFYPTRPMRFDDVDNDLVRVAGAVREAGGQILRLTGRVLDRNGKPVPGARVEIWQCDVNGRYMHTADRGGRPRDMAFQGFGHDITDDEGRYRFRTIAPVPYPGRTPHVHVKILTNRRELTTQLYIAGDPRNLRDGIFRRLSAAERQAVEMRFRETDEGLRTEVDLVI